MVTRGSKALIRMVCHPPPERPVTATREGSEVAVRVRDTGVGIPPEMLCRVFEPFAQVDRSLARSQGGLGIGLALVKYLVEMHGGSVQATSMGPRQGSEFVVRLPRLPEAPLTDGGAPATRPAACGFAVPPER